MRHAVPLAFLALLLAACDGGGTAADAFTTGHDGSLPPVPPGLTAYCPLPTAEGTECDDPGAWCRSEGCGGMRACYCQDGTWTCREITLCDLGEGATCPLEGSPACGVPPTGGTCTCRGIESRCAYACPLPECPDYDPGSSACSCASPDCAPDAAPG